MPRPDRDLARLAHRRLSAVVGPGAAVGVPAPAHARDTSRAARTERREAGWIPRPPGLADQDHEPASPAPGVDPASDRPPLTTAAPAGQDAPAEGRATAALRLASTGYTAAHGDPVARLQVPRRRVRWAISWRLAAGAGAVVLLVAGAVALRAASAAPGPAVALPTPAPDGPVAAAVPTPSSTASPAAGVVVDVVGAVVAPAVVRLPQGSRVVDAIAAAGGVTAEAQVGALNLARVLVDGEQIAVPGAGEEVTGAGAAPPDGGDDLVDVNTADAAALDGLPGIGPVLAARIVAHREERPFTTVDELADVAGIGPTLLERLRDLVRV